MTPPRFVLYTRVSTAQQDSNNSHPTQLAALEAYAQKRGGEVVEVIRETASGGAYLGRPGIRRALELLEENEADVLACYDFSRYSRDEEHQQMMLRSIESLGKRLEFTTLELSRGEDGQLTPEGKLMFSVSGGFAAYHRAKITADCTRGLRRIARDGRQPCNARAPLGYQTVSKNDVLTGKAPHDQLNKYLVAEPGASLVRELFARRAGGESLTNLCRDFNERGIPTSAGGREWHLSTLKAILSNTVYVGRATYGRNGRTHDEKRLARGLKTPYARKRRSDEDTIFIDAPPLVSAEIFDAVQSLWHQSQSKGENRSYLLSGLLRCPLCDTPMMGRTRKRTYKRRGEVVKRFYCCQRALKSYQNGLTCRQTEYDAPDLDGRILQTLALLHDDETFFRSAFDRPAAPVDTRALELQEQIGALDARQRLLVEAQLRLLGLGGDARVHETMLVELAVQRRKLGERLATLSSARPKGRDEAGRRALVSQLATLAQKGIEPGEVPVFARLLAQIIERIEIGPDGSLSVSFRE